MNSRDDPISIPHLFTKKQDIEIAGFFAAVFAWGNRTTIINKSRELMQLMDLSPYEFCLNHSETELKRLLSFKHRTFNTTDLLYFIEFLQYHYTRYDSLEDAFLKNAGKEFKKSTGGKNRAGGTSKVSEKSQSGEESGLLKADPMKNILSGFHHYFFSLEPVPQRTRKHIATPDKGSTCKRLNMFLRWMVRRDNKGVDFGIWRKIKPSQLICPIDVHVARVAKRLNLLTRKQIDWQAALELTEYLRTLDAIDPVKYDFALFGSGVIEKY
jgi:uncharacterized protein (TIGR02757 family)